MKNSILAVCMAANVVALPALCEDMDTGVISRADAEIDKGEGWTFYSYFTGPSYGVEKTLTGMAVIEPGREIHAPHVHADEEYLLVTQGQGEWSVKEKTFQAQAGDMLYAAPWDEHGVKNTGDTPLVFVVFKFHGKNVPVPEKPE